MADSLVILLHTDSSNTPQIYYCPRSVTANFGYYYSNSKTYEQMKNSGLLRLVKPRSLLDRIANYYLSFHWLANQTELMRLKIDQIHKGNYELFDSYVFREMMNIKYNYYNSRHVMINKPGGHPPLISHDLSKINFVSTNYHYMYATTKFYDQTAALQKGVAIRLIQLIETGYPKD